MSNQANPYRSALDALEKDFAEVERQRNELLTTINVLRSKAGLPPRPEGGGTGGSASPDGTPEAPKASLASIKHDTFFGKRMGTAVREYLEMRQAAINGSNPASTREIFEALQQGGFVFETKDDNVALVSLRNMLRKNTQMFQKLPNRMYGLRSWYPNVKKPKNISAPDASGNDTDTETAVNKDIETETATVKKTAAAS